MINPRFKRTLAAVCLGWALLILTAYPAGAVPYAKKAIYDGTDLAYFGWFGFSQNGDLVYPTEDFVGGVWVDSLYLYRHTEGSATKIFSGSGIDIFTQINAQGQVVWVATDEIAQHKRIYLYKNGVATPISPATCDSGEPALNDRGQVAYCVYSPPATNPQFIYFYDGNTSTPVNTTPADVGGPVINDIGQIAWYQGNDSVSFFDGSTIQSLASVPSQGLQLNQDGWVTWTTGSGLYLYKGGNPATDTVQLANVSGCSAKFGGSGQVVWTQPLPGYGTTILYQYLNGVIGTVSLHGAVWYYDVNRKGQIVYAGSDNTIYLYNNGTTTQISPAGGYKAPLINDNGQIVYFSNNSSDNSLDSVYVYNRGITKIDDPQSQAAITYNRNLQLINNGQIAWLEYTSTFPEMRILLASPAPVTNGALSLLLYD